VEKRRTDIALSDCAAHWYSATATGEYGSVLAHRAARTTPPTVNIDERPFADPYTSGPQDDPKACITTTGKIARSAVILAGC